jgi:hypothetical protein
VHGETDVELGLGRGLCVLETEISKSFKSASVSMPDSSVSMRNDTFGRLAVVATALASNHPLLQRVDIAGNETGKGKKKLSDNERIAERRILMSRDERRELMFSVRDGDGEDQSESVNSTRLHAAEGRGHFRAKWKFSHSRIVVGINYTQ